MSFDRRDFLLSVPTVLPASLAGDIGRSSSTQARTVPGVRSPEEKLREIVSFRDFECDDGQFVQLNGIHEDASGIQKALDYARLSGRSCRAGTAGIALLEKPVYFPDGAHFRGEGNPEMDGYVRGTVFKAGPGFTSGSVLGARGHPGGARRFWSGYLGFFMIHGNPSAVKQWGLEFVDDLGRLICPQDTSLIEAIFTRYCPSGGGFFPDGLLPGTIRNWRPLWNGGPGLKVDNRGQPNTLVEIYGLSGDGNNGGLLSLRGFNAHNTVNVYGMKAERYMSPDFPKGDQQINAIVLEGCDDMRLNLFGPHSISAVRDGSGFRKPGDLIRIASGGAPLLSWMGAVVRVRSGDTGADPRIVSFGGTSVPYSISSGTFVPAGVETVHAAVHGSRFWTHGGGSYANRSVETGGFQVAGATPAFSLHEQGAAPDSKTWLTTASASALTRRVVSDAGATATYETVERMGAAPLKLSWSVPVSPGVHTKSQGPRALPNASVQVNTITMISDPMAGKGRLVYSDGAAWRYVSDDSLV